MPPLRSVTPEAVGPNPVVLTGPNPASIGDTGTGNRDVNWTTAFSNANFTVSGCIASTGASVNHMLVGARTTADVNVFTRDAENGNLDDEEQSVIAFGDQ